MYPPIRLIGLLCIAGILLVLPVAASAHGSSGSAVMDAAPGSGYSAIPDNSVSATGINGRSDAGTGYTGEVIAAGKGVGGSGDTPAAGFPEQGSGGGTTTGISDTASESADDDNTGVLSASQRHPSPGNILGDGESEGDKNHVEGSGPEAGRNNGYSSEDSPGEIPRSFQGSAAGSEESSGTGSNPTGPGLQNQQESPGYGENSGIPSSSRNPDSQARQNGASAPSPKSSFKGKGGEQLGNEKTSAGPLQGIVLLGIAGGNVMSMEGRTFPAESMPPYDSRGAGSSFPERRGNPWGDSPHNQLPPATTGIEPEAKNPVSRPKGKREEDLLNPPQTDESEPRPTPCSPAGAIPSLLFSLFGYRRIHKKNVLQNEARSRIFQVIQDHPGIDVVTLSDAAGMNINTVRYHLVKLIGTGKITYLTRPGILRYYPNQGSYSVFEQLIIHYLRNPSTSAIIALLHRQPGITRQDIADSLRISGPSVTRHMHQLIEDRIVFNIPEGVTNHYRLSAESVATLEDLQDKISPGSKPSLAANQVSRIVSS